MVASKSVPALTSAAFAEINVVFYIGMSSEVTAMIDF